MIKQLFLVLISFLIGQPGWPQAPGVQLKEYTTKNAGNIINEFRELLSLPNVAADPTGLQKTAAFIMTMMRKRGIQSVQLLNASTRGVPPAVYGEVLVPGAKQTLIFYAHYDGQPVNPAQWATELPPFEPQLFSNAFDRGGRNLPFPADGRYQNEWRIYARSSSDDKAGVVAILNAYEAIRKAGQTPGCNLKFFFEGEEEAGSPHLNEILENYRPLLQSDLWIICDGPVHQSGKK